eukprot:NODE_4596_length_658_cov_232.749585.p2 GENE.NODE_4596_length_658_cov_232.749585~~NODE_4596_length_658_cov_232.749585.p2  ORF type:complete len:151 (+),score=1.98 NODE_4596_length_658_cov_232.749585:119-571(+)
MRRDSAAAPPEAGTPLSECHHWGHVGQPEQTTPAVGSHMRLLRQVASLRDQRRHGWRASPQPRKQGAHARPPCGREGARAAGDRNASQSPRCGHLGQLGIGRDDAVGRTKWPAGGGVPPLRQPAKLRDNDTMARFTTARLCSTCRHSALA